MPAHADVAATVGLPAGLAAAIMRAVEHHGGDGDDVRDLALVWRRVLDDSERPTAAIRSTVARRRCACADGGTETHAIEDAGPLWSLPRSAGRRGGDVVTRPPLNRSQLGANLRRALALAEQIDGRKKRRVLAEIGAALDRGQLDPSIRELAHRADLRPVVVVTIVDGLARAGVLDVERRGVGERNRYRLPDRRPK
jgi:hypothetical protein